MSNEILNNFIKIKSSRGKLSFNVPCNVPNEIPENLKTNINTVTVKELRNLCDKWCIIRRGKTKKEDIVTLIRNYFKVNIDKSSEESKEPKEIKSKEIKSKEIKSKEPKEIKSKEPKEIKSKEIKELISINSIDAFEISLRNCNDKDNKTRENIICAIINNKIPDNYYNDNRWNLKKEATFNCLIELNNRNPYIKVVCIHSGGRKNNHDFKITFSYQDKPDETFPVEFKFNVLCVSETPQIVSPMNIHKFMYNLSYQEYFYDNYMLSLSEKFNEPMPNREEYLKQIQSNKPKCMANYTTKYYKGCPNSSKYTGEPKYIELCKFAKEISKKSITDFINSHALDIKSLSEYLHTTQKDKIYMLFKDNKFILEKIDTDYYNLVSVKKNSKLSRYECTTKNGGQIQVLLRWKNGNGIAFPAFQLKLLEKKDR